MQRVGRPMENIIIIDNSPNSYQFQPENGIPCTSWYDAPDDNELMDFSPALKLLSNSLIDDVRPIVLQSVVDNEFHPDFCFKICENIINMK
jgi:carboxy-terminal domain RNA polymerase II polypeptide A small phosphatase